MRASKRTNERGALPIAAKTHEVTMISSRRSVLRGVSVLACAVMLSTATPATSADPPKGAAPVKTAAAGAPQKGAAQGKAGAPPVATAPPKTDAEKDLDDIKALRDELKKKQKQVELDLKDKQAKAEAELATKRASFVSEADKKKSDAKKKHVEALYKRGMDLSGAKSPDWSRANTFFSAAHEDDPTDLKVERMLGRSEQMLGNNYLNAANHLRRSLALYPAGVKLPKDAQKEKNDTMAWLEEAKTHIGVVQLDIQPQGARDKVNVTINNNPEPIPLTTLGSEIFIEPGKVTISVGSPNYSSPAPETKEVNAGKPEVWKITLTVVESPIKPPPDPKPDVSGTPTAGRGGDPVKDGKKKDPPPPPPVTAPTGDPGPEATGPNKTLLRIGLGTVAVGVGAGLGVLLFGFGEKERADVLRDDLLRQGGRTVCAPPMSNPDCGKFVSATHSATVSTNAGIWTLTGAGAVGVGLLIYALAAQPTDQSDKGKDKKPSTKVSFIVTPGGAGASVQGNF